MTFAKDMGKNILQNISKNLTDKYSQKRLDHTMKSAAYALKTTSKRAIKKMQNQSE